jgi:hypothetical protein
MPTMGAHARRSRRPAAGVRYSDSDPSPGVMTSDIFAGAAPEQIAEVRGEGRRNARQSGVTHRSPSSDNPEMPCCGRMLSAVSAQDRVTTNPALVTCGG